MANKQTHHNNETPAVLLSQTGFLHLPPQSRSSPHFCPWGHGIRCSMNAVTLELATALNNSLCVLGKYCNPKGLWTCHWRKNWFVRISRSSIYYKLNIFQPKIHKPIWCCEYLRHTAAANSIYVTLSVKIQAKVSKSNNEKTRNKFLPLISIFDMTLLIQY